MSEKILYSPEDVRETLEELFTYIPYFEERVNGTFKFQYYDEEKDQMVDFEGYEEKNRAAKFPYPTDDEAFEEFKQIFFGKNGFRVTRQSYTPEPESGELSFQEHFTNVLFCLTYDLVHERLCTGHTAWCMASGRYLRELILLQGMSNGTIKTKNDMTETINALNKKYGLE